MFNRDYVNNDTITTAITTRKITMNSTEKAALIAEYNLQNHRMNQQRKENEAEDGRHQKRQEIMRIAKDEYDPDMNHAMLVRMAVVIHNRVIIRSIKNDAYMSFNEISQVMGITEAKVKVLYINASRHLKCLMESRGIELDIENTREDLQGIF